MSFADLDLDERSQLDQDAEAWREHLSRIPAELEREMAVLDLSPVAHGEDPVAAAIRAMLKMATLLQTANM